MQEAQSDVQMSGSRRRSRARQQSIVEVEEEEALDADDRKSDGEYDGTAVSVGERDDSYNVAAKLKAHGVTVWNTAERLRVERGLMLFGFGAWEKKAEMMKFTRTAEEIKAAELLLI